MESQIQSVFVGQGSLEDQHEKIQELLTSSFDEEGVLKILKNLKMNYQLCLQIFPHTFEKLKASFTPKQAILLKKDFPIFNAYSSDGLHPLFLVEASHIITKIPKQYLLKIINPHINFRKILVLNEVRVIKSLEFFNNVASIKHPDLAPGMFSSLPLPKIVAYSVNNSGSDSPIKCEFVMYELDEPLFTKFKGSFFQQQVVSSLQQFIKSKAELDKEKEKADKELADKEKYISLGGFLQKKKIKGRSDIQLQNQQRRVGPLLFSFVKHFYELSQQYMTQGFISSFTNLSFQENPLELVDLGKLPKMLNQQIKNNEDAKHVESVKKVVNDLDEVVFAGSGQKGKNRAIKIFEENEWLNAYPGQSTEKNCIFYGPYKSFFTFLKNSMICLKNNLSETNTFDILFCSNPENLSTIDESRKESLINSLKQALYKIDSLSPPIIKEENFISEKDKQKQKQELKKEELELGALFELDRIAQNDSNTTILGPMEELKSYHLVHSALTNNNVLVSKKDGRILKIFGWEYSKFGLFDADKFFFDKIADLIGTGPGVPAMYPKGFIETSETKSKIFPYLGEQRKPYYKLAKKCFGVSFIGHNYYDYELDKEATKKHWILRGQKKIKKIEEYLNQFLQ